MNARLATAVVALFAGLSAPMAHASTQTFSGTISTPGAFTDHVVLNGLSLAGPADYRVFGGVSSTGYNITVPTPVPGFGVINVVISGSALNITALSLIGATTYSDTDLSDGFDFSVVAPGSYNLAISGFNPNSGGLSGLYAGEVTVSAVPEAETLALALAGLGVVGSVVSRRSRRQA